MGCVCDIATVLRPCGPGCVWHQTPVGRLAALRAEVARLRAEVTELRAANDRATQAFMRRCIECDGLREALEEAAKSEVHSQACFSVETRACIPQCPVNRARRALERTPSC